MGRMSAYVLVGVPFFMAGTITLLSRDYMDPLFFTSTGQKMLVVGLVMIGIGSLMLRKIVNFKGLIRDAVAHLRRTPTGRCRLSRQRGRHASEPRAP